MIKKWLLSLLGLLLVGAVSIFVYLNYMYEVELTELPEPIGQPRVEPVPSNWLESQANRLTEKAAFLKKHETAYDWFVRFPFSKTDGMPLVALKVLPLLAPNIWGPETEFGETFGLFQPSDSSAFPLPLGIGFTGLSSEAGAVPDRATFTCGACHVGRVRLKDGSLRQIVGGVNSQFNIVKFFVDVKKTFDVLAAGEVGEQRTSKIAEDIKAAAIRASKRSNIFFYGDVAFRGRKFDAEYERNQLALYVADYKKLAADFISYVDSFTAAYATYLSKTYGGFEKEMLAGLPGMADATGVSTSHGYEKANVNFIGRLIGHSILPDHPGLTDFMVVWEQGTREARWDPRSGKLIDGGGQYNGNIPIPIYRNIAASMTMGLDDTDLRVAAYSEELLSGLPSDPYPFDVNLELAEKGKAIFSRNCAKCHQPNNSRVYRSIGTDPSRSKVVNGLIMEASRVASLETCGPTTTIVMHGAKHRPCQMFKGQKISPEDRMRPLGDQWGGYNATALNGVWASAPFLHNGSVPTLKDLLVPSGRPNKFIKSALSYDTQKVGFALADGHDEGYEFNAQAFHALSNKGHDQDVVEDGIVYKLDWSDDLDSAAALIEYMKLL